MLASLGWERCVVLLGVVPVLAAACNRRDGTTHGSGAEGAVGASQVRPHSVSGGAASNTPSPDAGLFPEASDGSDASSASPAQVEPEPATLTPADSGAESGPVELGKADCYYLATAITNRWPLADVALQNAAARWERWYVPGDLSCAVRVLSSVRPGFDDWGRAGDILLDPGKGEIVDGADCEGDRYLLIDVLTHELGYVYGLEWTGARGRAMSTHDYCEPVVPTAAEIEAAR